MSKTLDFLKAGGAGQVELNEQRRIRTEIVNRWDTIGFTKGLSGHLKENIATLYENTAKQLLKEATTTQSSGSFETVVFPIVRRVFSKLLANEIVSVQALNLPIGKLFYFYPTTSERYADGDVMRHAGMMGANVLDRNNSGNTKTQYFLPDSIIPASGATIPTYIQKAVYDLYYDDFLYDNSKGAIHINVTNQAIAPASLQDNGTFVTSGVTFTNLADGNSLRYVTCKVSGFQSYNAGRLIGPDGNEMDSEAFIASLKVVAAKDIPSATSGVTAFKAGEEIPFRLIAQKYGKGIVEYDNICAANGKLYIELDFGKPSTVKNLSGMVGVAATGITTTGLTVSWAVYDTLELEDEMGEVSFELKSVTVDTEERKLRATWSPELATDVAAFQNIDAEAELTALLSEQIAAEIDREILRDLRKGAPWQMTWDYTGWRKIDAVSTVYTQKEWNQTLITAINQVDAQINKATLRGGVNFIVVSSEISAVFNDLNYFNVTDASGESDQYNMGIEKVGSLSGRYTVYRDPYAPAFSCLLGHKGKDLLDTGYIYAPYTPLTLTNTLTAFTNFANVKGISTRYAKKLVNNKFYGHIRVFGLHTWDKKELR